MDPYRRLSEVYDAGWGPWTRQYVELIGDWLEQEGLPHAQVLDLGCGSGILATELAGLGHEVVGLDASKEMIALAKARGTPRTTFAVQDMAACTWPLAFDLATCTFDAFNYLLTEARVERFFSHVSRLLKPRGLLIFDSNSAQLYSVHHRGTHQRTVGALRFRQACEFDASTGLASTVFSFEDGTEERHLQRAWSRDELLLPMAAAGLTLVAALSGVDGSPHWDDSDRLLGVARKLP